MLKGACPIFGWALFFVTDGETGIYGHFTGYFSTKGCFLSIKAANL